MKKIHVLGLALFAMFAFVAISAVSAFAASGPAEWLVKGVSIGAGEELPIEIEGEILLINLKAPIIGLTEILCTSGIITGHTDGPNFGLVTDVLTLAEVSVQLPNAGLECEGEHGCEKVKDAKVWPDNLPWLVTLELMELAGGAELFLALLSEDGNGFPGYEAECLAFGIAASELCEGEASAFLSLEATSLLGTFEPIEQEAEGLEGRCHEENGIALVSGNGTIRRTNGEELSVSSEGKEA